MREVHILTVEFGTLSVRTLTLAPYSSTNTDTYSLFTEYLSYFCRIYSVNRHYRLMKTCSTRSIRHDQYLCNNRETND